MVLRTVCLVFLLLGLCGPCALFAVESPENGGAAVVSEPTTPELSELSARFTSLNDFVISSEERLKKLAELSEQDDSLTTIAQQFEQIRDEMQPLGPPDEWYVDRLNHYLNRFGQLRQNLDDLQQRLTSRQQESEKIRTQLLKSLEFWSGWEAELKKQDVKLPKQTISEAKQQLGRLQKQLKLTSDQLLQVQEKIGAFQRELILASDQLAGALGKLRQATFRRNAYSFL